MSGPQIKILIEAQTGNHSLSQTVNIISYLEIAVIIYIDDDYSPPTQFSPSVPIDIKMDV